MDKKPLPQEIIDEIFTWTNLTTRIDMLDLVSDDMYRAHVNCSCREIHVSKLCDLIAKRNRIQFYTTKDWSYILDNTVDLTHFGKYIDISQ